MTAEHEEHLQRLKDDFCKMVDEKYRDGVIEHGGKLWTKDGLLDEAIMEVLDLWVYLRTKKEQEDGTVQRH